MRQRPITAEPRTGELLSDRYRAVREETISLAERLAVEDQVVQCEEASPTKWHLGHDVVFRAIRPQGATGELRADRRSIRPDLQLVLPNGRADAPRPDRGTLSRPTVEQIHDYRSRIDDALLRLLASRADDTELLGLIELGLNHEEQHQELLLTDAKQVLFANALEVAYLATAVAPRSSGSVPLEFRFEPAGFAEVGADSRASPSTTSVRAIESGSRRTRSRTGSSRTANTASSSVTAVMRRRCCGSPTVGRSCKSAAGIGRSAGRRISTASTRSADGEPSITTRRSVTSASTKPRHSPLGPARACRRKKMGKCRRRRRPRRGQSAVYRLAAPRAGGQRRASFASCRFGATSGNGALRRIVLTRGFGRSRLARRIQRQVHATSGSRAARASRRRGTSARATEISSILRTAGSSWIRLAKDQ